MTGHACPACGATIPLGMFACARDWARLPRPLQRAISAAYGARLRAVLDAAPPDQIRARQQAHDAAKAAGVAWFSNHPTGAP